MRNYTVYARNPHLNKDELVLMTTLVTLFCRGLHCREPILSSGGTRQFEEIAKRAISDDTSIVLSVGLLAFVVAQLGLQGNLSDRSDRCVFTGVFVVAVAVTLYAPTLLRNVFKCLIFCILLSTSMLWQALRTSCRLSRAFR
jgi:hypothetical protein